MTQPLTDSGYYELKAQVSRLADEQTQLVAELRAMRERIYGNGKPGILQDLSTIEHKMEKVDAKVDLVIVGISARDKIAYTLAGIVLPLVVGLLWKIFTGEIVIR